MQSHILLVTRMIVTRCGRPADMMLLPGILLLLLLLCRVELGRAAPTRPNVLMVIVDDLVCQSASTTAPCQQQHTLCWTAPSTVQSVLGCQLLTDRRVPVGREADAADADNGLCTLCVANCHPHQGYGDVGWRSADRTRGGTGDIVTPTIDALAAAGVKLNAY
jgi:hypothetical protein